MSGDKTTIDPIAGLASTCEAIAKGQFDTIDDLAAIVASDDLPNDIKDLAETFASMVVQVEAREFHASQLIEDLRETQRQLEAAQRQLKKENADLKQRLGKFKVEYDKEQASQEVEDISESDYFRELQERAKSMRDKFKSGA